MWNYRETVYGILIFAVFFSGNLKEKSCCDFFFFSNEFDAELIIFFTMSITGSLLELKAVVCWLFFLLASTNYSRARGRTRTNERQTRARRDNFHKYMHR